MKIKILRIKLSLMIVVMLLSILSYSQTAKTTYNFSTAASLSFGSGGFGIWYTQADITIDGTAYRLTSGGNGSFSNLSSGGVSNSACLKKDGSGGDQFTLQRVDGQPFQFYGIWVNHQSMNLYSTLGLTLPPWYTLTASTFSFQDNTPMTAGTNWDNYTYSTQTISAGTNGVTTTSVSIVFPAIIYYSIDDIIVGPVPSIASTVTTQAVSNINATTATGNGNITSLGSPNPTAYGICWNTTGTPTTANSKVDKGAASATGAFTASMTGLAAGTTYYVRAFATNNAGTSYGSQVSFTTTSTLPAISSFTPTSACPGTTITISGTNFTGASSVSFGGTEATSFSVVNATTITAVVANGTSGSVSVTTAEGTGTKTGFTMKPSIPGTLTYNSAIGALTMVSDGQAGSIDYCGITLNVYGANSGLSILTNAMTYEANIYPGVNGLAANYLSGEGSDYIIIKSSDNSVNFSLQSLQLIDYGGNDVKIEGFDNSSPTGSINYITNVNPWYFTLTQSGALTPSKFQDIDEVRISGQSGGPIWIAINNIQLSTPVSTPIVSSVSVPTNATYIIGQNLDFTVNFSAAVTVVTTGGTPYIPITLNTGGTVNATYVSGSGTTALVFRYTVASGNLDNNRVSVGTAIIANGGTLKNAGSTDANLILNSVGSTTGVLVDGVRPTATIVVADNALIAGETSLVTITFSEAVTGFTNADLTISNGTLSAVSSGDGGVTWTATFTPAASLEDATNVITLNITGIADAAGNAGTGATNSNNYTIDTLRPTASIVVADNALIAGETSLVTITFSEAVSGFTNADLTIANGTLSSVSSGDGGVTWTATLTPTASVEDATNVITLDNTGVSDASGNSGTGTTNSNNYAIDTKRPTASIVVADNALIAGETSLVTITFSEAVSGFTNADLTIANGTLSSVSSGDGGVTWTGTFTPAASLEDATNVITLDNTGVSDASGNAGTGATNSNNYAIDTLRPTASIVVADNALIAGETSLVTITFSEAVTGFTNADLTIANGTLSSVSSGDGGETWTATLTPTASLEDATNVITLNNTGIADAAGNAGTGATNSNNYAIDTLRPTASIVVADNALIAGETSLVTITFSEAVSGFTNADLTIANGTLSSVSSGDGGVTWTATLTPTASVEDGTNVITLDNTGVSDASGNSGTGATNSNNYAIDTKRPTAIIVVADNALKAGETSLVTITFSEAVSGFTNADLTIVNGTLSAVSSGDGGV
ncbi:MAG TPA: glycosyl hydrolase, partial [Prolixibacteraceae bacterium]|nr:glycosyl hydrolase [Prolixibacteraceae bacterium]